MTLRFLFLLLIAPTLLLAGGGPQNVLVVVNQNSSNSVALGRHYQQQRGIADQNLLRLSVATTNNISVDDYLSDIQDPIFDYLDKSGLEDQIDYIVFSRDFPYRVVEGDFNNMRHASLTSTMYYNLYTSPNAITAGCNLATGSFNLYSGTETAFQRPDPPVDSTYRISAMLTAWNQEQAITLVDRAVAADFTHPDAFVYFEHGEDVHRNLRWPGYEETAFKMFLTPGGPTPVLVDGLFDLTPRTNAIGLMTGLQAYPRFNITEFLPGAIADHLTSLSGFLFNNTEGEGWREPNQMKLPTWISNGVAGTIGPVVEPCGFLAKFPTPDVHDRYGRGFSLGESYMMSVANPYQSVFVGDPLTQPYGHPPQVQLDGFLPGEIVSGTISMTITSTVSGATGGIDRVDLYVNDYFYATIDRKPLEPQNIITATIDGLDATYIVMPSDTLSDISQGLATAINTSAPPMPVIATALGDRIMLRQKQLATSGTGIFYSVGIDIGTATNTSLLAWTSGDHLIDSSFFALTTSRLTNSAVQVGDVFSAIITRLDGVIVTNEVIAGSGWNGRTVMTNLMTAINNDPELTGPSGVRVGKYMHNVYGTSRAELAFHARIPGWAGYAPSITLTSSSSNHTFTGGGLFNQNTNTLTARGMIFLSAGDPARVTHFDLDTTTLPDGPFTLRVVAHRGDGPGTQGHVVRSLIINNHDLACAITNLASGAELNLGEIIPVYVDASDPGASVTNVQLFIEGKPVFTTNQLPFEFTFDTSDYGPGPLTLQAFAQNDLGHSTLSEPVLTTIIFPTITSHGTPYEWLISYGFTNNFETAASDDQDGDGVPTWHEYIMLTNPTNANDFLRITNAIPQADQTAVYWTAATGRLYGVHGTTNLLAPYQTLATNLHVGVYTDTLHQTSPQFFYTLDVILAP